MRVTLPTSSILEKIPELVPAFRQLGDTIPLEIEVDAHLTLDAENEKRLRDQYPLYWDQFTSMEWRIWMNLCQEDGGNRSELKAVVCAELVRLSEEGDFETSNLVDVHIKNIRRKLVHLGDDHHIESKRGWGYILREGPEPILERSHRAQNLLDLLIPVKHSPKKVREDGRIEKIVKTRKHTRVVLTPIEFNYMKEMKMDDVSLESAAKELNLHPTYLEWAWLAPNYTTYLKKRGKMKSFKPTSNGASSSGRTAAFGAVNEGSTPSAPANITEEAESIMSELMV